MKIVLLTLLVTLSLFADLKHQLFNLYQNKEYSKVCTIGINGINKYREDEDYISIYAFGCLYSDNIDQLAVPITLLKSSEESRTNAAYLSTILMQKKLLLNALVDNISLSSFILPSTDYILSKVFSLYSKEKVDIGKKIFDTQDTRKYYILKIRKTNNKNIIVIEEYYDKILTSRHLYY